MRVAGVYPQKMSIDPKIQHAVSEPYGLQMILAVAKSQGHDVEMFMPLVDEDGELKEISEEEMIKRIIDYKPDVVGLSMYTAQYPMGTRVAAEIKKAIPNAIIVGGNRYPTFVKDRIDEPFDYFVEKEGESTFKELLTVIEKGENVGSVKGISFRRNGEVIYTGIRERNFNLDALPNALRFGVILNQTYKGISIPALSTNPHYAIVEYSRCCYNNCKFCDNEGFWGHRVTFRSPKRVVDEMFELKKKGVNIFYFMDLNFTAFPKKTEELCKEMIERKLDASWYCMSNISTVEGREYLLDLMKLAGCFKIAWGIESTNDRSLEIMDKSTGGKMLKNDQANKVLQRSVDSGILNQGYYIIGFPWETYETIAEDAKAIKNIPIHQLNIGIFTPIPLSKFFNEMKVDGYVFDHDLENYDRNRLVFNHKHVNNSQLKELQSTIYHGFYDAPEYMERVRKSCEIDPRFKKAFNDYFNFMGKDMKV